MIEFCGTMAIMYCPKIRPICHNMYPITLRFFSTSFASATKNSNSAEEEEEEKRPKKV